MSLGLPRDPPGPTRDPWEPSLEGSASAMGDLKNIEKLCVCSFPALGGPWGVHRGSLVVPGRSLGGFLGVLGRPLGFLALECP